MFDGITEKTRKLTDTIFFHGRISLINIFIDKLSLRNQMILLAGATLLGNTLIIGMNLLNKNNNLQNILTGYIVIGIFSLLSAGYMGTCAGKKAEQVVGALNALTKGNLGEKLKMPGRDEFAWMSYEYNNTLKAINKIVKEMNAMIFDLRNGKLDIRGNADSFSGKWKELVNGFNELTDALVTPINMTAEYIDRIGRGDIPEEITGEYKGDLNDIKNSLNKCIEAVNGLVAETVMLTEGAVEGKLDIRGDAEKFGGDYARIINGINNTLDAVTGPINVAAAYIDRIARGDIPDIITKEFMGDFNDIRNNLNALIRVTGETTNIVDEIARGNLMVTVKKRSDQDELMNALEDMVSYLREVANVTERVSNKDLHVDVKPKSDQDVLNISVQRMVTNLQQMMEDVETSMQTVEQQNWLKTGLAELGNTMHGEQESTALARNIIIYLANYLKAQIGAIYLADEKNSFHLAGSYAWRRRKGNSNIFELGEGLIGQAALEKQNIIFSDIPDDYIYISSGTGKTVPRNILVFPFIYEEKTKGVVELGTSHEFRDADIDFIKEAAENIAIAFNTAQTREKMRELLEATRKQADELTIQQEELRSTNDELEERTKALEQQQAAIERKNSDLKEARRKIEQKADELEMVSKYKSEFLANMSHELRTPLNSILLLSQILTRNESGNLTEKQTKFSKTIYKSGTDLLTLINEILDLSKVEAGKIEVQLEDVNLNGFSSDINQLFGQVAKEKGVSLVTEIDDNLPDYICTDGQRLKQIIRNLLSNAFKFTTRGQVLLRIFRPGPEIRLSQSGLENIKTVAFAVVDTGIGIPEDKKTAIFEAFQQADGTTSRKYGGTGLGLSISREFSKLLGGEVQVESEEGKGSTFTLFLPEGAENEVGPKRRTERDDDIRKTGTEKMPRSNEQMVGDNTEDGIGKIPEGGGTLLIIEDDPNFSEVLSDLAREKGYKCLIAADGESGLQLAMKNNPDAIMLDSGLPGMGGWEVIEILKKHSETRHIPVHVISSSDKPEHAAKADIVGYLTKPVSMEQFDEAFRKIENFISRDIDKILIVEDNEIQRDVLMELTDRDGITPVAVGAAEDAYDLITREHFDCMILDLDLGLGRMSGFDLLAKLKENEAPRIPVIIHTGRELTPEEDKELREHAEGIVIKGEQSQEKLTMKMAPFLSRGEKSQPVEKPIQPVEKPEKPLEKPVQPVEKPAQLRPEKDSDVVLAGKKMLIVDDDMRNVFVLTNILEEMEIDILVGGDGREAIEILGRNPDTDLVLMDIMMPNMDGYEATREIRKQERFAKLPIIALTAKAMKGDREKCMKAGANDYLAKPIDIDNLVSVLKKWIGN